MDESEAKERLEKIGQNKLVEVKRVQWYVMLFGQFKSLPILMLAAAAANALHGAMGGDKPTGAGGADWGPAAPRAPANAAGGTVLPASGEVLASVAPGETIVPRGGFKALGGSEAPAQAGKGNTDVDVDVGGVHFHGVSQKTAGELISMAESALADVLERAAMEAGTA